MDFQRGTIVFLVLLCDYGRPAHSVSQCLNNLALPLDSINNFFQNVALTDRHKSVESFNVPTDSHDAAFQFGELSVEVVLSCLSSLDLSKATGPDGLSARFLKEISNEI